MVIATAMTRARAVLVTKAGASGKVVLVAVNSLVRGSLATGSAATSDQLKISRAALETAQTNASLPAVRRQRRVIAFDASSPAGISRQASSRPTTPIDDRSSTS